jgi:hypothetical protein
VGEGLEAKMAKEYLRRFYFVETWNGSWYVIKAQNKVEARSHGVQEFGRGGVKDVRLADDGDVKSYIHNKGLTSVEEIDEA